MSNDVNLVTLLQLKTMSERISAMITGLLTEEEVASLVNDTEFNAGITKLQEEHQTILDDLEVVKTATTYPSAEEASV